jgi:hypothetical protein
MDVSNKVTGPLNIKGVRGAYIPPKTQIHQASTTCEDQTKMCKNNETETGSRKEKLLAPLVEMD